MLWPLGGDLLEISKNGYSNYIARLGSGRHRGASG